MYELERNDRKVLQSEQSKMAVDALLGGKRSWHYAQIITVHINANLWLILLMSALIKKNRLTR